MTNTSLNIFYEEPNPDRWLKYDRYPRNIIRRLIRGKHRPGGVMTMAINLMKGLDQLGIPYRFNDYKHIRKHPEEIACIIGKPHVLFEQTWKNPIIFGAGVYSHPIEYPDLLATHPNIKRFLVPGEWMRLMCEPYYGSKVVAWPAGIDTNFWSPAQTGSPKKFDFLIYKKVPDNDLTTAIVSALTKRGFKYHHITYGNYKISELKQKLIDSKAVIYLSKSETQGLAYQQILAFNVPVLAWEKGGYWEDPAYYPHKIKFQPVSSVPYWNEDCGLKFFNKFDFETKLETFMNNIGHYKPRTYILENLTLEKSALRYLEIYQQVKLELQ